MPTTTNFGWTTPADTDLVKDGALAMRTLGNGIDTSMAQLKGGTTGQILSKTSNTDMAFTWINNDQGDLTAITAGTGISVTSGTGPIPTVALTVPVVETSGGTNQTTYTTGDLLYATATNTLGKRAIGSSGQVLTVSGGVPSWSTPSGGDFTLITPTSTANTSGSVSTSGGAVTASSVYSLSINGIFTTTYANYLIIINGLNGNSGNIFARLRNSGTDTTTAYYAGMVYQIWTGNTVSGNGTNNGSSFIACGMTTSQDSGTHLWLQNPKASSNTTYQSTMTKQDAMAVVCGQLRDTTGYDGITFFHESGSGNYFSGTFRVYGFKN